MSLSVHRVDDLHSPVGPSRLRRTWQEEADRVRRVVVETRFPRVRNDQAALAISPDGRQVAVAFGDVRLRIYAMPDLKLIKEFHFACRAARSTPIRQLVYSPDGKSLLAAQQDRTTPRLIDTATLEETTLDEGHGDRVVDFRFSTDGRTLRSVANDGTVCTWDATTMKMLRRISLPADRIVADIQPSDGRYAFCPVSAYRTGPVGIIDLDSGKVCCEVDLPIAWHGAAASRQGLADLTQVYWLNHHEALCTGYFIETGIGRQNHWWRFNYRTGEVLREGRLKIGKQTALCNSWGVVTEEDGKHLFFVEPGGKGSPPHRAGRIDARTLRVTDLGRIERSVNGGFGLVPGGKYFRLGSHIYDRRTLRLVAATESTDGKVDIGWTAFSPDGSRCAAWLSRSGENAKPESVFFVWDAQRNRVLSAFRLGMPVSQLRFSQDGTQLAIAHHDGTLEVRSIPAVPSDDPAGRKGTR